MIDLTIKTLDGNDHKFSVEDEITVGQFKEKVREQMGVEVGLQRLIFFGRVMQDEKKLSEYGVHEKVIHMVQRPPPCLEARQAALRERELERERERNYANQITYNDPNPTTITEAQDQLRRLLALASTAQGIEIEDHPGINLSTTALRLEFLRHIIDEIKASIEALKINESDEPRNYPNEDPLESASNSETTRLTDEVVCYAHSTPLLFQLDSVAGNSRESRGQRIRSMRPSYQTPPRDFAALVDDLHHLDGEFAPFRETYIMTLRDANDTSLHLSEEQLQRRQRSADLCAELYHSFSHAYHTVSDIGLMLSHNNSRLTSEPLLRHTLPVQAQINVVQPTTRRRLHNPAATNNGAGQSADGQGIQTDSNQSDFENLFRGLGQGGALGGVEVVMSMEEIPQGLGGQGQNNNGATTGAPQANEGTGATDQPNNGAPVYIPQTTWTTELPNGDLVHNIVASVLRYGFPPGVEGFYHVQNYETMDQPLDLLSRYLSQVQTLGQNPVQIPSQNAGQTPGQNAGQTTGQNAGQTPGQNVGQTPSQNASQTPGQNAGQTLGRNPGQTPGQNPGQTPRQNPVPTTSQNPVQTPAQNPVQTPGQNPVQTQGQTPGQNPAQTQGQSRDQTQEQNQTQGEEQPRGQNPVENQPEPQIFTRRNPSQTTERPQENQNRTERNTYMNTTIWPRQQSLIRILPPRPRYHTLPINTLVYDRFLTCDSPHARRQLQRRREETSRNGGLLLRGDNFPRIRHDVETLFERFDRETVNEESLMIAGVVILREATSFSSGRILATEELMPLRERLQVHFRGVMHGRYELGTQEQLADLLFERYSRFINRIHSITPIRRNVDILESMRAVLVRFLNESMTVLDLETEEVFLRRFRICIPRMFYELCGVISYCCLEGVEGLRMLYRSFLSELIQNIDEPVRDLLLSLSMENLEAAIYRIEMKKIHYAQFIRRKPLDSGSHSSDSEDSSPMDDEEMLRAIPLPIGPMDTNEVVEQLPFTSPPPPPKKLNTDAGSSRLARVASEGNSKPLGSRASASSSSPAATTSSPNPLCGPLVPYVPAIPETPPSAPEIPEVSANVGRYMDPPNSVVSASQSLRPLPLRSSIPPQNFGISRMSHELGDSSPPPDSPDGVGFVPPAQIAQHWGEDWVPTFTRDLQRQRDTAEPYSDAYLSGMPPRKRRCVRQSRPATTLNAFINESVSEVSSEPRQEQRVAHPEYVREHVRRLLHRLAHERAAASEDYDPRRLVATERFLNQNRTSTQKSPEKSSSE